jgi:four helix bundle protein
VISNQVSVIGKEKKYASTVEDLEVFQLAFSLSLEIHRATLKFPKIEQYALADQLRRSSKSICANIAEGFGKQRGSKLEFKRFLLMAIGSSDEVKIWLKYALELEYLNPEQGNAWRDSYGRVSRMLQSLYSSVSDNR